MSDSDN